MVGLAASVYAAAGAGHDFHDMVGKFTCAQLVHEDTSVSKGMCHADLELEAVKVDFGLFDAVEAAHLCELDAGKGLAGIYLIYSAKGRLHDASRGSEDGCGA